TARNSEARLRSGKGAPLATASQDRVDVRTCVVIAAREFESTAVGFQLSPSVETLPMQRLISPKDASMISIAASRKGSAAKVIPPSFLPALEVRPAVWAVLGLEPLVVIPFCPFPDLLGVLMLALGRIGIGRVDNDDLQSITDLERCSRPVKMPRL